MYFLPLFSGLKILFLIWLLLYSITTWVNLNKQYVLGFLSNAL